MATKTKARRMTATQAASIVGMHVRVAARESGRAIEDIDYTMCSEIVSEMRGGHQGGWCQGVARLANPKTVLRLAIKEA